jgi:hypothetical protein
MDRLDGLEYLAYLEAFHVCFIGFLLDFTIVWYS